MGRGLKGGVGGWVGEQSQEEGGGGGVRGLVGGRIVPACGRLSLDPACPAPTSSHLLCRRVLPCTAVYCLVLLLLQEKAMLLLRNLVYNSQADIQAVLLWSSNALLAAVRDALQRSTGQTAVRLSRAGLQHATGRVCLHVGPAAQPG